jgi:hypothetical protein
MEASDRFMLWPLTLRDTAPDASVEMPVTNPCLL